MLLSYSVLLLLLLQHVVDLVIVTNRIIKRANRRRLDYNNLGTYTHTYIQPPLYLENYALLDHQKGKEEKSPAKIREQS